MKHKKRNRYLAVSVGYAALSTTLKISGTTNISKQSWNVYWANPVVTAGSVTTTPPVLSAESGQTLNTIATWNVTLNQPGDFYEFTIDAVNAGSIDAMITNINNTVSPALPSYIKYTVAYDNGGTPTKNDLLAKKNSTNTIEKYLVRVYFDPTAITQEELNAMEDSVTYTFTYEVEYGQADSNATAERFACPGPNCVYSYYVTTNVIPQLYYADNGTNTRSTLSEYTTDYTTLKDTNDNQRSYFLGYILDNNDKITRGFVCGIKNMGEPTERVFCLEGTTDDSKYTNNLNLLQSRSLWGNTCVVRAGYPMYTDCGNSNDFHSTVYKDTTSHITIFSVSQGNYSCWVSNTGAMACGGGQGATANPGN